ncbi:MAG: rhombotarget lipoprotein [Holophagaceae bacterium]|nr:rhombotarget lipoprotein [Holophagaceae bacterium]
MRILYLAALTALMLLGLGCATPETIQRRSSLASYLGAKAAPAADALVGPVKLQLPLRLGIAFVPAETGQRQGSLAGNTATHLLSAGQEQALHQQVADLFGQKPWTLSFKIIPALYLTREGGFEDLTQVARSFGVDVVALVSVDQVQFSSPHWYAWTYWTLVGAYMVQGDKNDTTTLVDAAVYHVPSRTFLFRAGAVGTVKGSSTWSNREDAFRQQSQESLKLAMANLSTSLDQGVAGFKQDLVKGARKDVQLVDKDGNLLGSPGYDPTRK